MSKTRAITPNPPADFVPSKNDVSYLRPFRVWCQKVLPLVYDDSLSYYELLCKVVDYLNKTMEEVNQLGVDVSNLFNAFQQLQDYVNNYFSTLDVQEEINNKLDELVKSGELQEIFNKYINSYYGFVSVLDYGADPTGKQDSSSAFNKAISVCNESNGALGVPIGKYLISENLIDININVSIIGILDTQNDSFSNGSIIIDNRNSNTPLFNFTGGSGGNTIRNIAFWCRENENNDNAICIKGDHIGWDTRIYDCTFSFYDCALYLDGNDLQLNRVKIVFCGKDNYAFHLGTNSSMINSLHMEHCRLMLETPNLYTFANHISQSKFEMSTIYLSRNNKPFISLNGYNQYGLCNFTDCNFYCLDYLAFVEKGINYSDVPYMIDTGNIPSILNTTMYNCLGFYNCNFNIGAGSGSYTFNPISNNCKFITCSKPITMNGCIMHNLSGDLESAVFKNSRSKITNNKFYYDFTDFRETFYATFCKSTKELFEIYNCDFKYNTIYYNDSIFNVVSTECDVPNKYINFNGNKIAYPTITTPFTTSSIKGDYILLADVKLYNGASAVATMKIKDKFNGNSVVYELSACGSTSNVDTGAWKLEPIFKSSENMKMCVTANNNMLKIYYFVNSELTNKISLDVNIDIISAGNITKYTSLNFENPDKNIAYLEK